MKFNTETGIQTLSPTPPVASPTLTVKSVVFTNPSMKTSPSVNPGVSLFCTLSRTSKLLLLKRMGTGPAPCAVKQALKRTVLLVTEIPFVSELVHDILMFPATLDPCPGKPKELILKPCSPKRVTESKRN